MISPGITRRFKRQIAVSLMPTKMPVKNKNGSILNFSRFFGREVIAFTATRGVDFTLKEGSAKPTSQQKGFLNKSAKSSFKHFPTFRQVHGRHVLLIKENSLYDSDYLGEADGAITNLPNLPLTVRTADCLPIFLYDPKHQGIALLHAGWRSSQKGIIANAVYLMKKSWGTKAKDLKVVFGPAIQECCYQVGSEFRKYFPKDVTKKGKNYFLDLPRVNRRQLTKMGIKRNNVFDCARCTCCDPKLFSFRREGEKAGRMASVMILKSKNLKKH